jgi:translation initiation factor IF-3
MLSELYKILLMASISIIIVIFGMYQYVSYQNDKLEIQNKNYNEELIKVPMQIDANKFETKYETINELLKEQDEIKHEKLDTSIGKHSITFRP